MPGAPERVGCGPRRSPGRIGGRPVPGPPGPLGPTPCPGYGGRGRWKIGLPRSGSPVRGAAVLAAGRGGAAYTGRGPVCGTMSRRCGTMGLWATGAVLAGAGAGPEGLSSPAACAAFSAAGGATTAAASTAAEVSTGGSTTCAAASTTVSTGFGASATGAAAGLSAAGGGATGALGGNVTVAGGRATLCGVIKRGAGFDGCAGVAIVATTGGFAAVLGGRGGTAAAGVALVRGGAEGAAAVGRGGAAGWAAFCVIAFRTSPGFEMCERSILGLNSSVPGRVLRLEEELPGSPCSA
jgi:hypothetical protein